MSTELERELMEAAIERREVRTRREAFRRYLRIGDLLGQIEWEVSGHDNWARGVELGEEAMVQGAKLLRLLRAEKARREGTA